MAVMPGIKSTQRSCQVPFRTLRRMLIGTCVTALSLLMFAPGIWIPALHSEDGHGHDSCHTGFVETDPCHRKIVHSDFERGCAHAQHLSGESTYCAGCRLLFAGFQQFVHCFVPDARFSMEAPVLVFLGLAHPLSLTLLARGRSPPLPV